MNIFSFRYHQVYWRECQACLAALLCLRRQKMKLNEM